MLVWLVVVALISAVVVGAVSVGAARLFSVPGPIRSSVAPSAVAVGPSASPTASDAGVCTERPAVTTATLTPIAVPHNVTKLVFSRCVVWARIGANNGGIAKIDLATNQVLDTIVPAEIVGDSMTGSDGGILADTSPANSDPNTLIPLIRIDPATDAVTTLLNLQVNGDFVVLDGQVWNRKWRSGELWLVPLDGSKPVQGGTIPSFIGAAFGSVWTQPSDGTGICCRYVLAAVERWDAPGLAPTASIDVGTDSQCLIADHGIACVSPSGRVALVSADTNTIAWSVQIPNWTGDMVNLAAADGSIWLQPAATQPGRTDAHELIELDAASGTILRRVELAVRQPLNLWAGGGSLWISGAGQPLARLDLPPR